MMRTLCALATIACVGVASAQTYPSRPITMYVPFTAGPTDTSVRKIAEVASRLLGQPIIADNKPGAGGTLAPVMASRAKPDGYTIAVAPSSIFRYHYIEKVDWEPLRDFSYISGLTSDDMTMQVVADSPFKTFGDVVAWAKANPGRLTYGTPGAGTSMHLFIETAASKLGTQFVHVPYKGAAEVTRALLGKETMVTVDTAGAILPQVQAGKARYLVQFSEKRAHWLSDVPTAKEQGLDLVYTIGVGLVGPKDMPAALQQRIHEAFKKGLEDPETLKLLDNVKKDPWPIGPAAYAAYAKKSVQEERSMVERAGMLAK